MRQRINQRAMTLSQTIRNLRKSRKLRQEQFADLIGVTQPTVSRWESGSAPEPDHLIAIAKLFDKSVDDLLGYISVNVDYRVRVVGEVSAGMWREAVENQIEDQYEISIARPKSAAADKAFGMVVRGSSMNLVYPDGATLICVRLLDLPRDLRSEGEHVIALRQRDGQLEATCKELVMEGGKPWLWPRSSDPRYQQPVPAFIDESRDDADHAEIYAVVIGSYIDRS